MSVDLYAQAEATIGGASLRLQTEWPNSPEVSLAVAPAAGGDAHPLTLRLRMPGWLAEPTVRVALSTANAAGAEQFVGKRGDYLVISRSWSAGDTLTFSLPMALRSSRYTGLNQIPGHQRWAVEYGPVLLAATGGAWNDALDSMLLTGVRKPAEPSTWLEPSGEAPLHFRVLGAGNEAVRFVAYYLIQEELFEVYPAV